MARVFVAGGTGVLGSAAVPLLREAGHEVVIASRSGEVRMDALDGEAVRAAVEQARPDFVVNALTALPAGGPRKASDLEPTNRLRRVGTDNLAAASEAVGACLISESFLLANVPGGGEATEALLHLERTTLGVNGVVLRFGLFYGPGSRVTDEQAAALKKRKLPLPGGAPSVFSFVHMEDAGRAVAAAVDRGEPGTIYEVADDQPVALGTFLTELARVTGAPKPRRIPLWLAKLVAPYATGFAAGLNVPLNNARLKELGWAPRHATYAEGLASGV
jgi:nucleoside-diphosphate-sugar epimerase